MTKKILIAIALFAVSLVGCHAQPTPKPTVYTCPAPGSYVALNQATPATGLTYTDTHPAAGTYCYVATSYLASTGQLSDPSNVAGPFTVNGTNSVLLTWNAPTVPPTPSGYILSRIPATQTTLFAPSLVNGNVAEVKPALPLQDAVETAYAPNHPVRLGGKVW